MAVTQISKIQVRRGRQENLPQLAAGELGWAIDTQQLYIGNGSFEQGAPNEGNTEILTEFSNTGASFQTQTLTDDTSSATEFYSFNKTSYPAGVINYSIVRDGVYLTGDIQYAYDGVIADTISITNSSTGGSLGITISANVSGELIVFKYTSTSTGYDALIRFRKINYF
jgi:hypothetical protein